VIRSARKEGGLASGSRFPPSSGALNLLWPTRDFVPAGGLGLTGVLCGAVGMWGVRCGCGFRGDFVDDALWGVDPASFGGEAGVSADGAEYGAAGYLHVVNLLDDGIEHRVGIFAAARSKAGGMGVAVESKSAQAGVPAPRKRKGKNAGQRPAVRTAERRLSIFERALWRQTVLGRGAGIPARWRRRG
jgi:hypothetical protein